MHKRHPYFWATLPIFLVLSIFWVRGPKLSETGTAFQKNLKINSSSSWEKSNCLSLSVSNISDVTNILGYMAKILETKTEIQDTEIKVTLSIFRSLPLFWATGPKYWTQTQKYWQQTRQQYFGVATINKKNIHKDFKIKRIIQQRQL